MYRQTKGIIEVATIRTLAAGKRTAKRFQVQIRVRGYRPHNVIYSTTDGWTLKAVRDEAAEIEEAMRQGRWDGVEANTNPLNMTISDACDEYLRLRTAVKIERQRGCNNTGDKELQRIERLKLEFGQYTFRTLSKPVLRRWGDERLADGLKWSTVRNDLAILSAVIKWWQKHRELKLPNGNPARPLLHKSDDELFEKNKMRESEIIPVDDLRKLFKACKEHSNPRLYQIVRLAFETGMRKSEVRQIELSNIDLKNRYLYLPYTKTGKPRYVALTAAAVKLLDKAINHPEPPRGDSSLLFPATDRRARKKNQGYQFDAAWYEALKRAGLYDDSKPKGYKTKYRFHYLRHTKITEMAELGVPLEQRMLQAGHTTTKTALKYAHVEKPKALLNVFLASEKAGHLDGMFSED